jgi:hypothetical protein
MIATESWSLRALRNLCAARHDLAERIKHRALQLTGLQRALLMRCASPIDTTPVFQALSELVEMSDEARRRVPVGILDDVDLDWVGREGLFVKVLRARDKHLASPLFGGSVPPTILNLGILEIGQIEWWLEWILEANTKEDAWFADQLWGLFGRHLAREKQDEFVAEFNNPGSKFRRVLQRNVLPYLGDLATDALGDDALSFLLADLNREKSVSSFRGHLLGSAATEQFVSDRLLPLLSDAKPPLSNNLRSVLKQAGSRHGRRYLLE